MPSKKKSFLPFAVRATVSLFVLICTIEALHWPLVMKPGIQLAWWQVRWLAMTGDYVGFPVVVAAIAIGMIGLPSFIFHTVMYSLAALWTYCIFGVLSWPKMEPNQAPEPAPTTGTPPAGQEARQP
jgi:hypothetical protein